jgi:hypothetical protein
MRNDDGMKPGGGEDNVANYRKQKTTYYWVVNGEVMGIYFLLWLFFYIVVCLHVMEIMGFYFQWHLLRCNVFLGCIYGGVEWFARRP